MLLQATTAAVTPKANPPPCSPACLSVPGSVLNLAFSPAVSGCLSSSHSPAAMLSQHSKFFTYWRPLLKIFQFQCFLSILWQQIQFHKLYQFNNCLPQGSNLFSSIFVITIGLKRVVMVCFGSSNDIANRCVLKIRIKSWSLPRQKMKNWCNKNKTIAKGSELKKNMKRWVRLHTKTEGGSQWKTGF